MAMLRECRLSDTENRKIDLRNFEEEIKSIIEKTVPGKNPKVYKDHFTTDPLDRGESIKVGRALSKNKKLSAYGKTVTIFRLFDGRNVEVKDSSSQSKGGRIRK